MRYKSEKSVFTILVMGLCLFFGGFRLPAQSLYTVTESFDSRLTFSSFPQGMWDTVGRFNCSPPFSCRGIMPEQQGDTCTLTSPVYDFSSYGQVFLLFDHICKISRNDIACVEIREDYLGAVWHRISSDCYRGGSSAYRQQQFSDASYPEWLSDSVSATPSDTWWKTECFNLTSEAAYSKIQFRFKLKKGTDASGQFAFGWLLDNIRLYAGDRNVLPPYLSLTGRVYAGTVGETGPFVVRFRAEEGFPVQLSATYTIGQQPNKAEIMSEGAGVYAFRIPATAFGNTFTYTVQAMDSAGNAFTLFRAFRNPMPEDGRDSNSAGLVRLVSPASRHLVAGERHSLLLQFRNTGIFTLNSLRICWSFQGKGGEMQWRGYLPAGFLSDTVQAGSFLPVSGSDSLKVWLEQPNGVQDYSPPDTLCMLLDVCNNVLRGTYLVGGVRADFPDLASAVGQARKCGISGTVVFALDSGTRLSVMDFGQLRGWDSDDSLVITSVTGRPEDAVVVADSLHSWIIRLEKVEGLCFRRLCFSIDSSVTQCGSAVLIADSCSRISVEECLFLLGHKDAQGVSAFGANGCGHLVFRGNRFVGGHSALFVRGGRLHDYHHVVLEGNLFENQCAYGVYMMAADFTRITGNRFRSDGAANPHNRNYTGIDLYACCGHLVEANRFRLLSGRFAMSFSGLMPDSARWVYVRNNEVRFFCRQQQSAGLLLGSSCRNVQLLHNSLLLDGNAYGNSCVSVSGISDSIRWGNNLFVQLGTGSRNCIWQFSAPFHATVAGHWMEGCHYHAPSGGYVFTDHLLTRLEEWLGFCGRDIGATEGRVDFRDTSLDLSTVGACPVCLRLSEAELDADNRIRTAPITVKGAYHRVGSHNTDALLLRLLSPDGSLQAGDSLPLRVVLANGGRIPLEKVRVGYEWNGVRRSCTCMFSPLASGDTVHTVVLGSLQPVRGENVLKIWTFAPNDTLDGYPYNDTLKYNFFGCAAPLSGDYRVGGAHAAFPDLETALSTARHCGLAAPVRFLLHSGSYPLQAEIQGLIPGCSVRNTLCITSEAADADSVLLYRDSAGLGQRAALFVSRTAHLVFEHLHFMGSQAVQPQYSVAVECGDSCSDVSFRSCRFSAAEPHAVSSVCCGFYASDVTGDTLLFEHSMFEGGMYGVYVNGQGPAAGKSVLEFRNNLFSNHTDYSLMLREARLNDFSGNRLENLCLQASEAKQLLGNRFNSKGKQYCMQLDEAGPLPGNAVLTVDNNECISSGTSFHAAVEIGKYCHDLSCSHNSISVIGSGSGKCLFLQEDATVSNIRFRHNIFYQGSSGDTACILFSDLRFPSAYSFQDNRYGWLPFVDSSASLQLKTGSRAACLRLPDVPDDIYFRPRPVLSCLGAYPPPSNDIDACLFSLLSPQEKVSSGAFLPLRVIMGNWGDSLLHEALLVWELDGVLQDSMLWRGELAKGDTVVLDLGGVRVYGNSLLRVFLRHVGGGMDADCANDTLCRRLFVCDSVLHGSYRIGETFATLEEALDVLFHCGIGGDVFFLLPEGRYTGPWIFGQPVPGASEKSRVHLVSETPHAAVFTLADQLQTGSHVVLCSRTSHLSFEKICFEIPESQSDAYGIKLQFGCVDIAVDSCLFSMREHSRAALAQTSDWGVCRLRFAGNRINGGQNGLYFTASAARPDSLLNICGNRFFDIASCGIFLRQAQFSAISGNELLQLPKSGTGFYGIQAEQVRGVRLESNRIVASRAYYGMYFSAVSGSGGQLLVANNDLYLQVPSSNCGIYLYNGCRNMALLHNSILMEGRGMGKCLYTAFRLPDMLMRNNHFVNLCGNSGSTQNEVLYFYPGNGFSGWESDFNNYYTVGKNMAYCGSSVASLEAWRGYTGKDMHSRAMPPRYQDKTVSLKLVSYDSLSCPLWPGIPFDRDGMERSETTVMGAYQPAAAERTDWHPFAFDSLDTGPDCQEVFQPIRVKIRNEGSDTVCFQTHPLQVRVLVDGPLQLDATVRIVQGCLAPRHSGSYLLHPRFSFGISGTYRITVITMDAADSCRANDTLRTVFRVRRFLLPFATDMAGADTLVKFVRIQGSLDWRTDTSNDELSSRCGHATLCFPSEGERGGVARAVLPALDLSGVRNPSISLWYARNSRNRSDADRIRVLVSVGNDSNWCEVGRLFRYKQSAVQSEWERADIDLSAYAVPCLRIALEGVSYGGGNQYLDSLCVSGTPVLGISVNSVPDRVEDCSIPSRGLSIVIDNGASQPVFIDTADLQFGLLTPFQKSYRLEMPLHLPAYGSDTIFLDTSFVWETGRSYRMEAVLSAESSLLCDTLRCTVSAIAALKVLQLFEPPCVYSGESVYPSALLQNSGALDVYAVPVEIWLDDTLARSDTIPFLAAGDQLRYRCLSGVNAPESQTGQYALEIRFPLPCDADLGDNSAFVMACLLQREDTLAVRAPMTGNTVRIFPNPARNEAFIRFSLRGDYPVEVELLDIRGQLLYYCRVEGHQGENLVRIPAPGNGGICFCRVLSDGEVRTGKVFFCPND